MKLDKKSNWRIKDSLGRFKRKHQIWDGSKWNDGFIDFKGKFKVYRPDYPRSFNGYASRAHIVWWLKTNIVPPKDYVIHHKNEIKTDDRYKNLAMMKHSDHSSIHHKIELPKFKCKKCSKIFQRYSFRNRYKNNFCSHKCYSKFPKNFEKIKIKCQYCSASFKVIKSKSLRKFCSNSCSAKNRWSNNV